MSNIFKYGLIGASGRLGTEVVSLFSEKGNELVFSYDIEGKKADGKPDILIDCSLPAALPETVRLSGEYGVPLVIATTGLSDSDFALLKKLSGEYPVVQSYNYSVGIQVLLKLAGDAKQVLKDWDVEISETHHRFKKDKPSGTAKMIEGLFEERNVNVSSHRLGNVAGDHTVSFGGLGEILSITHRATSRRTFAEGILLSAEFALKKSKGFYSFTDVLFGKDK